MNPSYTYKTIEDISEGIYTDKGSRFIGYAMAVSTEIEFKTSLKEIRSKHASARHFCYAYRIGKPVPVERSNDDGEPSGTAGKPILNQLLSYQLTDTGIIVVRYFGGTLLGTTGLIKAYKGAAKESLENAKIIEKNITIAREMNVPYAAYNDFMNLLKKYQIKADITCSGEMVTTFMLELPLQMERELMEQIKKITSV